MRDQKAMIIHPRVGVMLFYNTLLYLILCLPARASDITTETSTEMLLETILRSVPTGVGLVQDRVILEVNDYIIDLTGYKRDELIGQSTKMLYLTEKDFYEVGDIIYTQVASQGTGITESRWIRKDGEIKEVLLTSTPLDPNDLTRGVIFSVLDITEQKKAEQKMLKTQKFQKSLLNAIPVPVFYKDHQGRYIGSNRSFSELMGLGSDEIIGKTVHELWPSDLADVYHQADLDLMKNPELQVYESKVTDRDGQLRPVIFGKQVFLDAEGNVAGLIGAFVDISDQKQAAAALVNRTRWFLFGTSLFSLMLLLLVFGLIVSFRRQRAAEREQREAQKNYRDIFDASSGAILVIEADTGKLIDVNQRMIALYGYADKAEALQSSITCLCDVEGGYSEVDFIRNIKSALSANHEPFEWRSKTKSGSCFWVRVNPSRLRLHGREHLLAELRDISGRKRIEDALRESEERLNLAMMIKNEGIWDWKILTNETHFDDRYYSMAGYAPNEFPQNFDSWANHVHPDDLNGATSCLDAYLAGETDQFDTEFRFKHKQGSWIWIRGHGKVVEWGSSGNPLRMIGTHTDITDRKMAEDALRKSEEKLLATLLSIGDGVITTDREGCVETMNPIAVTLTGWNEKDARGQPLTKVFDIISEDTGDVVKNPVAEVFAQGRIIGLANHTLLRNRDGTLYPIADSAAPIIISGDTVGAVLVFRDQTNEREQQRLLQESNDMLERKVEERTKALQKSEHQLVEAQRIGKTGHWSYSIKTGILNWSEQTYRIYDVEPSSFLVNYENVVALFHPDDRQTVENAWQNAITNHCPLDIEHRIVTPSQKVRYISQRAAITYDENGTPQEAIGFVADLTESKILQAELVRTERLAAVGTLVGGIAHEFNNINVPIVGYADLLIESNQLEGEALEYAKLIKRAGLRAKEVTHQLLTASGTREGNFCSASLVDVADEAISLIQNDAEMVGITFERQLNDTPPTRMIPGQLLQVILNLLINAQHALLESNRRIITVTTGSAADNVWVRVKDTGCGMPESDLSKIFSPFFSRKGEHSEKSSPLKNVRGSGLGLSVSHTIIESHGGRIDVSSVVGEGSVFTVYLPLVLSPSQENHTSLDNDPKSDSLSQGEKNQNSAFILVVDDEPDTGTLITAYMSSRGHTVESCTDPEFALQRISQKKFDVVILDYQMPGMSAADILHAVKDTDSSPRFIILSGHPADRISKATSDHRVKAFLKKPFVLKELTRVIDEVLSKSL